MKFLNIFAFSFVIATSIQAQTTREIAFYNVENLFDTLDGTNDDAEFLPAGKNAWNAVRYNEKLDHINKVFDQFSNPLFIGMCEIENAMVVRDVMKHSVKLNKYGLVHYESADARGVDVALIYDSSTMKLVGSGYIRFTLPGAEARATRDILWGKFKYKKETIIVMVNHWPSRSGGQEASEPNRLEAAKNARTFIDSLLNDNKKAKIVFMGDLNDYPSNKAPQSVAEKLTPQITALSGDFGGTYNYKGEWDILDHIMVSDGLINPACMKKKSIKVTPESGKIHAFDYLLEEYKGQVVPFRTYAGAKYLGGYSDHLPVSIEVSLP
jgi:predicted extracellular nuclease